MEIFGRPASGDLLWVGETIDSKVATSFVEELMVDTKGLRRGGEVKLFGGGSFCAKRGETMHHHVKRIHDAIKRPNYSPVAAPTTPRAVNQFLARSDEELEWFNDFDDGIMGPLPPSCYSKCHT